MIDIQMTHHIVLTVGPPKFHDERRFEIFDLTLGALEDYIVEAFNLDSLDECTIRSVLTGNDLELEDELQRLSEHDSYEVWNARGRRQLGTFSLPPIGQGPKAVEPTPAAAAPRLYAIVSTPTNGEWAVLFEFVVPPNGRRIKGLPTFQLPARSYEHARRIERAFNEGDR